MASCRRGVQILFLESVASHAEAMSGATPRRTLGSRIRSVQANASFGRLISARRLPAMPSSERCLVLEASSSMSPKRGSINAGEGLARRSISACLRPLFLMRYMEPRWGPA
jgi:hypothetical protein